MSEDQFTKLFKYIEQRFDKVDKQLEEARQDRNDIRGAVAELSAQVRDYHAEMLAQSRQMDRLREAVLQIAKETGVKLQTDL